MAHWNISSGLTADKWIGIPRPNPRATVRLFCLPYAGSGANVFYRWQHSLPDGVELCLVHLPGRGKRLREKPLSSMDSLLNALERPMLGYLDLPMAIFGHSMGALIGFELARHLRSKYGVQPARLFVSGCNPPRNKYIHQSPESFPTRQFISELRRIECLPVGYSEQFVELALPALKADLSVCETYSYTTGQPLDCDIAAFGGFQDCIVKYEQLEEWRSETTGHFGLHVFRGGHFFVHTAESFVLKAVSSELCKVACEEAGEIRNRSSLEANSLQQIDKTVV